MIIKESSGIIIKQRPVNGVMECRRTCPKRRHDAWCYCKRERDHAGDHKCTNGHRFTSEEAQRFFGALDGIAEQFHVDEITRP